MRRLLARPGAGFLEGAAHEHPGEVLAVLGRSR